MRPWSSSDGHKPGHLEGGRKRGQLENSRFERDAKEFGQAGPRAGRTLGVGLFFTAIGLMLVLANGGGVPESMHAPATESGPLLQRALALLESSLGGATGVGLMIVGSILTARVALRGEEAKHAGAKPAVGNSPRRG